MKKPDALTPDEWKALLGFYEAIHTHDWKRLDEVVSPDWEDLPPAPSQQRGPDGVKPLLQGLVDAFPDLTAEIEEVIAEQGRAAARVVLHGTHNGVLFGIPPTGKKVAFSLHEFHQFAEGRIVQTRHMEDWMTLFRQIGAFPKE